MIKGILGIAALGVVGAFGYYALNVEDYSRNVDQPQAEVAAAIADLDMRAAVGAANPADADQHSFTTERAHDKVSYLVRSGGTVAARMTAWLDPVDDGKHTRVRISVLRGPAPDDQVAPAFRSMGDTRAMFTAALDKEIDQIAPRP